MPSDSSPHLFYRMKWSLANICLLFKKNGRSLACNYHPVSLTFVSFKMLEHDVCSNIMPHLNELKILLDKQHAFRKNILRNLT